MAIDGFKQLVTILASLAAAGTGIWNIWWQIRGKHDQFIVGLDGITTMIEPETVMHVVNLSDHPIKLKDWGFIGSDRKLLSFRLAWETGELGSEQIVTRGESILVERGATFETGYTLEQRPLGAYAVSITQRRPRIYFDNAAPIWLKIWIHLRLWFQPNYFVW